MDILESVVIGAGQAGLSASYHLRRLGIRHLVLDADERPGGAWQHRWDALTMVDVHGVAELPGSQPPPRTAARANRVVPAYFGSYEREHALPVLRPVSVHTVTDEDGILVVHAAQGEWRTRTLVNATGTWTRPFLPHHPGRESFLGEQLHTVDYPGPDHFRGKRVLVVGGGASAVQFLGALAPITDTLWVTRREPVWRDDEFTPEAGAAAVALVEQRVAQGLPPQSVVSVTGLMLRPQEQEAARLGAYAARRPMFERIEPDGVRWADGTFERVDVILWATGFRPAIAHLAPLRLRSASGGIRLDRGGRGTTAVADPRVQLVGYGPSASTIGANRAGRTAATGVRRYLQEVRPADGLRLAS
ncbi:NAD(P)/FAD-dependent oxidoreductase [Microbacterium neungamense]|uniref:NAD(P)/FAD-dependent oxidoreductase n=1 Tax=Microbacterium neungamense TaxID=2810535 RepID=UPI00217E8512|nr:NAD(P)/FAD-dependent oxidoreductase [Microbacterium neungamense]UWF76682.1 NAD(P)/FAD-dependent oxidoreductase [Microbacterium neungamense]